MPTHHKKSVSNAVEQDITKIIDVAALQRMMDELFAVTKIGFSLIDLKGNVLVGTGWQEICTKFHRQNPETLKNCLESDLELTKGVKEGEYKIYKCKNGLVDIVTPLYIGKKHVANIFSGQFFFEDDEEDIDAFVAQADRYGFEKDPYLRAYRQAPRWHRGQVERLMLFYTQLTGMLSKVGLHKEELKRNNDELEMRVAERTKQVSRERQRLYSILETLPAYVILLDKDYRVVFANKIFRERFGESHGNRCYEYLFGRCAPCENCETYKVLKSTKNHYWEWTGPDKRNYDVFDFPFFEADGSMLILEMGIDVTERKLAEQAALEAATKLKDSERLAAIGAIAGMVGHDIRNPLQALSGDLFFAQKDVAQLPESHHKKKIQEDLKLMDSSIGYIAKIVQDLQDFARPIKVSLNETDLESLFEELLRNMDSSGVISAIYQVDSAAKRIITDELILKRILSNLVSNAIQAMPNGGKLTLLANIESENVVINIVDTGAGIPEEIQKKMFTPMFTTKAKGQGFGLAVAKRMSHELGGTISFESEMGKGTRFIVKLPLPKKNP